MIRIHYFRYDHDYEGLGLWTWDGTQGHNPEQQELLPAGHDDYGPWFLVSTAEYGAGEEATAMIGFIVRLHHDWARKDGEDRYWKAGLGREIWLVGGDPMIYSDRPDIAPRIKSAYLDGENRITACLTHAAELSRLVPTMFQVRDANGGLYKIAAVRSLDPEGGRARTVELTLDRAPGTEHEVVLLAEGYRHAVVIPRGRGAGPEQLVTKDEMGAICTPSHTIFRVFSPKAKGAHAVIYEHATGTAGRQIHAMDPVGRGIWETTVWGDLHGRHYMIYVDADAPTARKEAVDIYCRCATGADGHGMIIDPARLDPPNFRPIRRPANIHHPVDAVIYEAHVRDFTISKDSGVPARYRGKYLGMAQRGTVVPGTHFQTGLDHLVELGVTHVQLLPVQDFSNCEHSIEYNWGYMTVNFFSPEGWYATNPTDASRVREMKELVKALHDAGIRVILDIVFNHTANTAAFEAIAPGYYYRLHKDGTYWNGSGTGNEVCSEAPMARQFILDCCRYWVEEFGVDGFRLDLMGLIDLKTLVAIRDELRAIDPTLLLYGEPWAAFGPDGVGIDRISDKHVVSGNSIGAFNDNFRDSLKGFPDGKDRGYIQSGERRDGIRSGLLGGIHDWAVHPGEAIQYADCHDNLTLWDKLAASCPATPEEERLRMHSLAVGILAVSQGVMFLHGGTEFARTKGGHHNSYNAPDHINMFVWSRKARSHQLFVYTKTMIGLRRTHRIFRLGHRDEIDRRLRFRDDLCPTRNCIALHMDGRELDGESWTEALVLLNPEKKDSMFQIPGGIWSIYAQGLHADIEPFLEVTGTVPVPAYGMALLAR